MSINSWSDAAFIKKVIFCMHDFATSAEVIDEYDYLCDEYKEYENISPRNEMLRNIIDWVVMNYDKPHFEVVKRMKKAGLISRKQCLDLDRYCIENRKIHRGY